LVRSPARRLPWLPPTVAGLEPVSLSFADTLTTIFTGMPPARFTWDAITSPTPLDALRTDLALGMTMGAAHTNAMCSAFGGKGSEWINLATLAGGGWLLALRIIRWQIPVAMLTALVLRASVMSAADPGAYAGPLFHLTSGAS